MLNTVALMEIFQDTLKRSRDIEKLAWNTQVMQAKTTVYTELKGLAYKGLCPSLLLQEDTSFHAAAPFAAAGYKTAVLNFANAYQPGGGVVHGAMAQEECLCRSSNLYRSLEGSYVERHYYKWNQEQLEKNGRDLGSDRIIYSPFVTVYKTDDTYPKDLPEARWFNVDVITCAAPVSNPWRHEQDQQLYFNIFVRRIRSILETAEEHHQEVVILGAFGCGAFCNDPLLVAAAYYQVLVKEGYGAYFKKVVFAIKKNNHNNTNLAAFRQVFEQEKR